MNDRIITCEELELDLADLLEGSLEPGALRAAQTHLASCTPCASLVADLRRIEREAAALPALLPEHDLWSGIARRIEPQVIPLAPRTAAAPKRQRWYISALAAAGLVGVTAATTYQLTMSHQRQQIAIQSDTINPVASDDPRRIAATPVITIESDEPGSADPVRSERQAPAVRELATTSSAVRTVSGGLPAAVRESQAVYGREIVQLRQVIDQRRDELDPGIVAEVELNLQVIDAAIARSRQALSRDPRSRFLLDQLNDAMETKVELLRTVALLPASS